MREEARINEVIMGSGLNGRLTEAERKIKTLVEMIQSVGQAHNALAGAHAEVSRQTGMNTAFIQWALGNLDDRQFADFQAFMAEMGVEVEREPALMVPDKKIIMPGQ